MREVQNCPFIYEHFAGVGAVATAWVELIIQVQEDGDVAIRIFCYCPWIICSFRERLRGLGSRGHDVPWSEITHVSRAMAKKDKFQQGFCLGFVYAVATKLEQDRAICTPVNVNWLIKSASAAIPKASPKDQSWKVLEAAFRKDFPCN